MSRVKKKKKIKTPQHHFLYLPHLFAFHTSDGWKALWREEEKIVFLCSNTSVTTEVWKTPRLYSHIRIWFALQINLVLSNLTSSTSQGMPSPGLIPEVAEQSQIPLSEAVSTQSTLQIAGIFTGLWISSQLQKPSQSSGLLHLGRVWYQRWI